MSEGRTGPAAQIALVLMKTNLSLHRKCFFYFVLLNGCCKSHERGRRVDTACNVRFLHLYFIGKTKMLLHLADKRATGVFVNASIFHAKSVFVFIYRFRPVFMRKFRYFWELLI